MEPIYGENPSPNEYNSMENKENLEDNTLFAINNENKIDYIYNKNFFVERSFNEADDGYFDEEDFYHTPEGSFWNNEGDYFNRFGYDKYGGKYNEVGIYFPGEGWNEKYQCYEEDLDEEILKYRIDEIENLFEDQLEIYNNPCNISMYSSDYSEEVHTSNSHLLDKHQKDFLKVKDALDDEFKMQMKQNDIKISEKEYSSMKAPLYHGNYIDSTKKKDSDSNRENNFLIVNNTNVHNHNINFLSENKIVENITYVQNSIKKGFEY